MTFTYRAVGDVRGWCGHEHRTVDAAERCAERDRAACRHLPGGNSYSDRHVCIYRDGSIWDRLNSEPWEATNQERANESTH